MSIPATLGSMDAVGSFALLVTAKAALLYAVAAGVTLLVRRRSAASRHLIWSLAIAGAVVLPIVAAVLPVTLHLRPARTLSVDEHRLVDAAPASRGAAVGEPGTPGSAPHAESSVASLSAETVGTVKPFDWALALLALWLAGALVLLARFIVGAVRVHALVRRAAPAADSAWRISDEVAMPFAYGFFRPTVVLPSSSLDWSLERREAVLAHELAHLSRGDLLMNALSHLARALYWFNPLAWLASHRLRIESERACDDAVLRRGARASDYADHLLSIASNAAAHLPGAALAMARRSAFEGRLLAILEPGIERSAPSRWRVAVTTAVLLVVILPLAAASPTARVIAMSPALRFVPSSTAAVVPTASPANAPAVQERVVEEPARPVTNQQPASAVSALIETLGDGNAAVRLAVVNSLGSLNDPRAIAALGKALREDIDPRVREAAAAALGEIDDPQAVPHLLDALKAERVAAVRERIVESLREIDDPSAVAGVLAATRDSSAAVRRAAVSALGEFEDQSTVAAIAALARDADVEVRRQVADALGNLENPVGLNALISLSRDADPEVRESAVSGLGNLEDTRTLDALVAALKDSNADVRSQAADAIQNIPDLRRAPAPLIAALGDTDREVRHSVAHALGSIGDEAAVPALKNALADANVEVRRAVAEALSDIGGVEAITALMGLLKDRDPEIRRTAAEALGKDR
ncbi:MAG: HEAT repeat domain-containing protein [Gemmatimonadaceae bacterium]